MRAMQLEPNEVHFNVPESVLSTIAAPKKRLVLYSSSDDEAGDNQSTDSNESNTDLDFFQSYPIGTGFKLDCWGGGPTDLGRTGAKPTNSNQSRQDDPHDTDWSGSSTSSLEDEWEDDSVSTIHNDDDSDSKGILSSSFGERACRHQQQLILQMPKEEQQSEENEEESTRTLKHSTYSGISRAVRFIESNLFNTTTPLGRHVHFRATVVTAEFSYPRPSDDDFFRLYYSAHELQRLRDQPNLSSGSGKKCVN